MQTHLISFLVCIAIHISILLYTLYNTWKQNDFDFKKQFFSDPCYYSPLQNLFFVLSYVLGIISNRLDDENFYFRNDTSSYSVVIQIFSFVFIFIFLALMIFSFLILRKNQHVINLSYNSTICFLVQSAVCFSIATYLFLFSLLFIMQINKIFEDEILEIFTIVFYVIYTLVAITLLSKKELSFAGILVIVLIGCACNSYESRLRDFRDKELITLFTLIGTMLFCIIYMSVRYRKEIFLFKSNDDDYESFFNNKLVDSGRVDPTV